MHTFSSVREKFITQKRTFLKMSKNENLKYFSKKSEKNGCDHNALNDFFYFLFCDDNFFSIFCVKNLELNRYPFLDNNG